MDEEQRDSVRLRAWLVNEVKVKWRPCDTERVVQHWQIERERSKAYRWR